MYDSDSIFMIVESEENKNLWRNCPRFYDNRFNPIVFYENKNTCFNTITNIIQKWHGYSSKPMFISVDSVIGDKRDDRLIRSVGYQIKMGWVDRFYIIPQSRKIRSAIRKIFYDVSGKDIHIQMYSKIVECVYRNSFRK